ncbi:MAG TPA: SDR family oxidoreductase [Thermoplasmataceae archaeon]|nr:SDR family oxidoreductase [Thermoplasmataceae archaeon]
MDSADKGWVLVTGGSRGIGRATALHLAKKGYDIALTYNSGEQESQSLSREISDLGRRALRFRADLSKKDEISRFCSDARSQLGKIFALVNNAGIYTGSTLKETTDDEWDRVIGINLSAPFLISRNLADIVTDGGSVVNVSSVYGFRNDPWGFPYQASKSGLIHLTRALAKALAPRVRVNAVAPGYIRTDMNADGWTDDDFRTRIERRTPMKRWGEPADIARAIDFLIDPESSFITGSLLVVDGGIGI